MAEIGHIHGPSGPTSPSKKEKSSADADKFKELMKIQEVDETDAEARKKRKRPEEIVEEVEEKQATPEKEPDSTATSIFSPQQTTLASAPFSTEAPSGPSAPSSPAPASSSSEDEMWEDESSLNTLPSTPQPQATSAVSTPATEKPPSVSKTSSETAPEKEQKTSQKEAPKKATPFDKSLEETPALSNEAKKTFFATLGKEKPSGQVEEETAQHIEGIVPLPPHTPDAGVPKEKEGKEKKISPPSSASAAELLFQPQAPSIETPEATPIAPYSFLHPQTLALFERMLGVITVMSVSGIKETTVFLTSPQFASSVFYGSQIIIREFSTAPYALNVEIQTSPQGATLMQGNMSELMAAFQAGNYNFKINRLETTLLKDEKPLVKRKEGSMQEGKEQEQ